MENTAYKSRLEEEEKLPDNFHVLEIDRSANPEIEENYEDDYAEKTFPATPMSATLKIYRYTKHRVPGYDANGVESGVTRTLCDEKSIWTNCLCQFTCSQINIVDCYTPCESGCECREDYVFDEKLQHCVLPEQCQTKEDFIV